MAGAPAGGQAVGRAGGGGGRRIICILSAAARGWPHRMRLYALPTSHPPLDTAREKPPLYPGMKFIRTPLIKESDVTAAKIHPSLRACAISQQQQQQPAVAAKQSSGSINLQNNRRRGQFFCRARPCSYFCCARESFCVRAQPKLSPDIFWEFERISGQVMARGMGFYTHTQGAGSRG